MRPQQEQEVVDDDHPEAETIRTVATRLKIRFIQKIVSLRKATLSAAPHAHNMLYSF